MRGAESIGAASSYEDANGRQQQVPEATREALFQMLGPARMPSRKREAGHAHMPPLLEDGGRAYGMAVQLYALRSERNWGIGDFTDLSEVMRFAAEAGAAFVGVNPLHALFMAAPERRSPYYPSSRLFLNPLYIDPDDVAVGAEAAAVRTPEAERLIAAAREGDLIDYVAVARAKRPAFEALFAGFREGANKTRRTQFEQFREAAGEPLRRHALFEALHAHFMAEGMQGGFPAWPEAYHDPKSAAVAGFAEDHAEEVLFHEYLQWIAKLQLEHAAGAGVAMQPATALYLDLAVGAAPDGAEVWAGGDAYLPAARLGAPPDPMAPGGQDWGLATLNPCALAAEDYRPLQAVLEASMAYAGALRIDHILGFDRQFLIPEGATAKEGGYVIFPRDDMIAVTAEASRKTRCLVIGEDLGTVPEGLTAALHEASILSYEVARWAREEDGSFLRAEHYPRLCLAAATTHDIAPIPGWMSGHDLETRAEADDWGLDQKAKAAADHEKERRGLFALWGLEEDASPEEAVLAAHRFLGRSRAAVVMTALEDLLLQTEQVNLPGTMDEHPNWRRRYGPSLEEWTQDARVRARLEAAKR